MTIGNPKVTRWLEMIQQDPRLISLKVQNAQEDYAKSNLERENAYSIGNYMTTMQANCAANSRFSALSDNFYMLFYAYWVVPDASREDFIESLKLQMEMNSMVAANPSHPLCSATENEIFALRDTRKKIDEYKLLATTAKESFEREKDIVRRERETIQSLRETLERMKREREDEMKSFEGRVFSNANQLCDKKDAEIAMLHEQIGKHKEATAQEIEMMHAMYKKKLHDEEAMLTEKNVTLQKECSSLVSSMKQQHDAKNQSLVRMHQQELESAKAAVKLSKEEKVFAEQISTTERNQSSDLSFKLANTQELLKRAEFGISQRDSVLNVAKEAEKKLRDEKQLRDSELLLLKTQATETKLQMMRSLQEANDTLLKCKYTSQQKMADNDRLRQMVIDLRAKQDPQLCTIM